MHQVHKSTRNQAPNNIKKIDKKTQEFGILAPLMTPAMTG